MTDTPDALPPLFPAEGAAPSQPRVFAWSQQARPLGGLHMWLRGALITFAIAEIALAALNGSLLWLIAAAESGVEFSDLQFTLYDLLTGYTGIIASIIFVVAYILAAFLYCRFIYRALDNLDVSGARGDRIPPGWAVAYNFIPIMNIWKPMQAMMQAWRGSLDPELNRIGPPAVTGLWWGCWLVSNWISNFSFRLSMDSGAFGAEILDFESYKLSLWLDVASATIGIASAIFLLPIIGGITKAQDQKLRAA